MKSYPLPPYKYKYILFPTANFNWLARALTLIATIRLLPHKSDLMDIYKLGSMACSSSKNWSASSTARNKNIITWKKYNILHLLLELLCQISLTIVSNMYHRVGSVKHEEIPFSPYTSSEQYIAIFFYDVIYAFSNHTDFHFRCKLNEVVPRVFVAFLSRKG